MKRKEQNNSLGQIYVQYRPELCRYVVNKVGLTDDEAEDIVQTAFTKIAEGEISAIQNHRAFLYKTCFNLAIDLKRHGTICRKHVEEATEHYSDAVEELGPLRYLESKKKMSLLSKALRRMTRKRRQIIILSRIDGLSNAEIARRLGLSESVVRRHLLKALANCQDALDAENE